MSADDKVSQGFVVGALSSLLMDAIATHIAKAPGALPS